MAMREINAWSLLTRKAKGLKVSSRLLRRSMRKAALNTDISNLGLTYMEENLHSAYKQYYAVKEHHPSLRATALDTLAEACTAKNNISKATMIRTLNLREAQHSTARKIKHIRGKLNIGSTTVVSLWQADGSWKDITEKHEMEKAIMDVNEKKYQQSFHTLSCSHS
jgi:hypothetical protein